MFTSHSKDEKVLKFFVRDEFFSFDVRFWDNGLNCVIRLIFDITPLFGNAFLGTALLRSMNT